jgi:hypothetical protein
VSERMFTISMPESARLQLLKSLGAAVCLVEQLWDGPPTILFAPLYQLTETLTTTPGQDAPAPTSPASGTEAAKAILSPATPVHQPPAPIELKDRWQRSKKGVEVPFPEGCETIEAELWKVEPNPTRQNQPRWKITWAAPNGGQGFVDGSCFDEKLFPYLANRVKQKTVLHVVKNGKYLNVVGVRA